MSVRLSVSRVDQSKTVAVRIMKFSPHCRPVPIVLLSKFHPEILTGPPERGFKQLETRQGWGNKPFLAFNVNNISKTVADILLLMTNRKSHVRFLLTPRSMTLDDLDLL